jgi:hypothetical protein
MAHGILALLLVWGADVTTNGDEFVARSAARATTVRVFEHSLIGPTIQLGKYGRTLRGTVWGAPTEVSWDGARVTGLSGGAPIDLAYRIEPDGELRMDGMFAGNLTHLYVGAMGIHGHIGPRDLALEARDGMYAGLFPTWMEIEIPRTLAAREPGELAATLPILLAGFAGPADAWFVPPRRLLPTVVEKPKGPVDYADAFRVAPPPGWPTAAKPPRHATMGAPISGTGSVGSSSSSSTTASHAMGRRGSSK